MLSRTLGPLVLWTLLVCSSQVFADDNGPALARVEEQVSAELGASKDGVAYVIVMLKPPPEQLTDIDARQAAIQTIRSRVLSKLKPEEFTPVYQYQNIAAMTGRVQQAGLTKIAADPDVLNVGADQRGEAHLDTSVPFINADDVHTLGFTGVGMTVAVLDSGIDTDHPDLSDNIAAGARHFLGQGANQGSGAEDDNGHGTNVSGIITSKGVVASRGVAPDADILAVKVLDASGAGFLSDWTAGVDYVVSVRGNYAHLCAINMSLGSNTLYSSCPCDNNNAFNQALQASILAARNAGIATFCSSGNAGSCTSMSSPACLSAATAVAAVYDIPLGREPDSGTYQSTFGSSFGACFETNAVPDIIACFSNRSGCNALAAPGRRITAPGMGGGLSTFSGTSQAAPHCTAVAALLREKDTRDCNMLTVSQLVETLKVTGHPTTDPCSTSPNPIRIDALAALNAVLLRGDLNLDHHVTVLDLAPFVNVLLGIDLNPAHILLADTNCDGAADGRDVQSMLDAILP